MKLVSTLGVLALLVPTAAQSQLIGKRSASSCLDLRENNVTVTGILKLQHLHQAHDGGSEHDAFMVELPDFDCVDEDSSAPVGDSDMLADIRVSTDDSHILRELTALVGRKVTVTGTARLGQIEPDGAPLVVVAARAEPSAD